MGSLFSGALDEEGCKEFAVVKGDDGPQDGDEDGYGESAAEQEDVEEEDVDDDRGDEDEAQNEISVGEKEGSAEDLDGGDEEVVVGLDECAEEVSGEAGGELAGDEVEKAVEAEDQEDQAEEGTGDQ